MFDTRQTPIWRTAPARVANIVEGADDGWGRALVSEGSDVAGSEWGGRGSERKSDTGTKSVRLARSWVQDGALWSESANGPPAGRRWEGVTPEDRRFAPQVELNDISRPASSVPWNCFRGKPMKQPHPGHEW